MRIEGMDAVRAGNSLIKAVGSVDSIRRDESIKIQNGEVLYSDDNSNYFTKKALNEAITKANKAISIEGRKFEYSVHEKTNQIMIKVFNSETNELIREIPPEKILDMVAKLWEMSGLFIDERR